MSKPGTKPRYKLRNLLPCPGQNNENLCATRNSLLRSFVGAWRKIEVSGFLLLNFILTIFKVQILINFFFFNRCAVGRGSNKFNWITYENQQDFGATFAEIETKFLNSKVKLQQVKKGICKTKGKKKNFSSLLSLNVLKK